MNNKNPDSDGLKRITRQIDHAFEEVAKLSGSNLAPTDFYETFLSRTLTGIDGFAGAIWIRTPQGFLQIQCQSNMAKVGLDDKPQGRQVHNELIRQAFTAAKSRPIMLEPYGIITSPEGAQAANLTDYIVILAPILSDDSTVIGLLETWVEPYADPRIHPTFARYIEQMAGYASNYNRNHSAKKNTQQEEVWTNLEKFTQKIHTSLNPPEVAFQIANEGRRLIECDRVSVGIRHGRKTTVECVSGADVVEKASVHVRSMRRLFDRVIDWNETLTYRGQRDESLPPAVLKALDTYLAESNSKLLVLKPLRDERERPKDKEKEKPCRSAVLMECFEPPERSEPLIQRLDVMAPHAASALYNAAEMKAIPLAFIWKPIGWVQKGIGGKTRMYILLGVVLLAALIFAMIKVPYPLKMDAKGTLLPKERNYIYPQVEGFVRDIKVRPRDIVSANSPVAELESMELRNDVIKLIGEIESARAQIEVLKKQANDEKISADQRREAQNQLEQQKSILDGKSKELQIKLDSTHSTRDKPGIIAVRAPVFERARQGTSPPIWRVISPNQNETLLNRMTKPTENILRIANTAGAWEVELKIPQKHIGQIYRAFKSNPVNDNEYLPVDIMLSSRTTERFKGRLYRKDISGEALANKDDHNESEPVLTAIVTINDPEMPEEDRIPEELLLTGLEVKTFIRCGDHSMGYSLFYGVWEFLYEHVVFWL